MKNCPGTTLTGSLLMPQKALELRFIEADIREELLDCIFLSNVSGVDWRASLLSRPRTYPRKGLSQMIQTRLQTPFSSERLTVCNMSRRRKGDGIAACWVRPNVLLNLAVSLPPSDSQLSKVDFTRLHDNQEASPGVGVPKTRTQ